MATTVITSYGTLHGPPPEGDAITLDLRRALYDPHRDPAMRQSTGLDPDVRNRVLRHPDAQRLIDSAVQRVLALAGHWLGAAQYRVDLHVYCQGGRHRSVAAAEEIASRLRAAGREVEVEHRDIGKPVVAH